MLGGSYVAAQVFKDPHSDKSWFVNLAIDSGDRFPRIMQKNGEREGRA